MADAAPRLRPRPLSPSVTTWRWHVTMVTSIMHRIAGSGLYVGALILMAWALSLAGGPDSYAAFVAVAGSIGGKIVFFLLTLGVFFHLFNGLRHLVWDVGYGFRPQTASSTAWLVIGAAAVATVLFWIALGLTGVL